MIKLHIGGWQEKEGWSILDVRPGPRVRDVGTCTDLSFLDDGSCAEVYASHVLEHLAYDTDLPRSLKEIHRVLAPGGRFRMSVPDLSVLSRLFQNETLSFGDRYAIMRIIFGGQADAHDFHCAGLWPELVNALLREAGFARITLVDQFGEFDDTSSQTYAGVLISCNVEAFK